jgi:hypothetical protein
MTCPRSMCQLRLWLLPTLSSRLLLPHNFPARRAASVDPIQSLRME